MTTSVIGKKKMKIFVLGSDKGKDLPKKLSDPMKVTMNTLKVLVAATQKSELTGYEIIKGTGMPSGSVYPLLLKMERAGWLESNWEEGDPKKLGRPLRKFYKITESGLLTLRDGYSLFPSKVISEVEEKIRRSDMNGNGDDFVIA